MKSSELSLKLGLVILAALSQAAWAGAPVPQAQCLKDKAAATSRANAAQLAVVSCRDGKDDSILKGVPINGTALGDADTYYRNTKLGVLARLDGADPADPSTMNPNTGKPVADVPSGSGFIGSLGLLSLDLSKRTSTFTPEQTQALSDFKSRLQGFENAVAGIRAKGTTNSVSLAKVDQQFNLLWQGCASAVAGYGAEGADGTCPVEAAPGSINQLEKLFDSFNADLKRVAPKEDLEGDIKTTADGLKQMGQIQGCRDAVFSAHSAAVASNQACSPPPNQDTGLTQESSGQPGLNTDALKSVCVAGKVPTPFLDSGEVCSDPALHPTATGPVPMVAYLPFDPSAQLAYGQYRSIGHDDPFQISGRRFEFQDGKIIFPGTPASAGGASAPTLALPKTMGQ